jgi:hypothetical protein
MIFSLTQFKIESRVINFQTEVINFCTLCTSSFTYKINRNDVGIKTNNKTAIKPKILTSIVFFNLYKKIDVCILKFLLLISSFRVETLTKHY